VVPPGRVEFPGTGVVAEVVPVGVLRSGALQIPEDPLRIGWWAAGAVPGQSGGAIVLAGHMDGLRHGGAMSVLLDIEPGQTVSIRDHRGGLHEYRIQSRRTAPRERLDPTLFTTDGPHRLVLITCGGTYDERAGRYTENIVVIAEPAPARANGH
jgi:sortase (surface protein transpeptidase)